MVRPLEPQWLVGFDHAFIEPCFVVSFSCASELTYWVFSFVDPCLISWAVDWEFVYHVRFYSYPSYARENNRFVLTYSKVKFSFEINWA